MCLHSCLFRVSIRLQRVMCVAGSWSTRSRVSEMVQSGINDSTVGYRRWYSRVSGILQTSIGDGTGGHWRWYSPVHPCLREHRRVVENCCPVPWCSREESSSTGWQSGMFSPWNCWCDKDHVLAAAPPRAALGPSDGSTQPSWMTPSRDRSRSQAFEWILADISPAVATSFSLV